MEFMVRPLCEAGRRGGVGPIVVPPFTPPTPQPSSLDFSSPRSTPRRRKRGGGRRRHTPSPAGPPGPRAGRSGRQIAGVTHTNTITTTYKDGGTPTVSRSSSRVSN